MTKDFVAEAMARGTGGLYWATVIAAFAPTNALFPVGDPRRILAR